MKTKFIKNGDSRALTLFFAGWGCDESLLDGRCLQNDLLYCYDYHTWHDFDLDWLSGYESIRVVAWSLGVWVAQQCLQDRELPLASVTAFNGTLCPVDERYGISPLIFEGTLRNLDNRNLMKFRRRMCGAEYEEFMRLGSKRGTLDMKEELQALYDGVMSQPQMPCVQRMWTRAVVSADDLIFSKDNQAAFWKKQNVEIVEVLGAHYSKTIIDELLK